MAGTRLEELDVLRGLAALAVAGTHYTTMCRDVGTLDWTFHWGMYGPPLFFVISGFVILMSVRKRPEAVDFLVSRASRIYPTYWLAVPIAFVAFRYFPLPGHFNSERAARAVESAARQGELEAMYSKMYETQESWGEAQEPHDELFRSFAEEIGLDMEQYDADYASEEVADRVARDLEDGTTLGVQGTPTFYLDGELFQPETVDDFSAALDEALAE